MSDLAEIREFAQRYAGAWCSGNPESVAAFFAENGSLSVNDGRPAVGRAAIAEGARGFRRDFPDMIVTTDKPTLAAGEGGRTSYASPARTDAVCHGSLPGTHR